MKKFLLVDDHEIVRLGVKAVVESLFAPCHVYEAIDEKSALIRLKEKNHDLVIMDVHMPDTNIFRLLEHIKLNFPATRILVFSMSAERIYAKKFMAAGALGYVPKNAGLPELRKAIEAALNNRKYISPEFADQLAMDFTNQTVNPFHSLTPKEFEISSLLMAGESVSAISKTLHISSSTVGTHKAKILHKLHAKNMVELCEMAKQYN